MARARRTKASEEEPKKPAKGPEKDLDAVELAAPAAPAAPPVSTKADEQPEAAKAAPPPAEEQRAVSVLDDETHERYEQVKKGELHITDLQRMTVNELHEIAKSEGLTEFVALKKQDLIFNILKRSLSAGRALRARVSASLSSP